MDVARGGARYLSDAHAHSGTNESMRALEVVVKDKESAFIKFCRCALWEWIHGVGES